uniref:Uncharacterized protein n=1 Tax=Strongyloides venezuelensis TaxID=75913 RepID=A0A0K0FJS9_STRVS
MNTQVLLTMIEEVPRNPIAKHMVMPLSFLKLLDRLCHASGIHEFRSMSEAERRNVKYVDYGLPNYIDIIPSI